VRRTLSSTEKSGCLSRRPDAWNSWVSCRRKHEKLLNHLSAGTVAMGTGRR
jgi:hypothetical protein